MFTLFLVAHRSGLAPVKFNNFKYFPNKSICEDLLIPQDAIIGYTPHNKATDKVMKHVILLLKRKGRVDYNRSWVVVPEIITGNENKVLSRGFTSEAESVKYYLKDRQHMRHIVVFHDMSNTSARMPTKVSITIRPHSPGTKWMTKQAYPFLVSNGPNFKDISKCTRKHSLCKSTPVCERSGCIVYVY
ncbi:hypothetical protein BsWGS_13836 [Bradybaena similaris]